MTLPAETTFAPIPTPKARDDTLDEDGDTFTDGDVRAVRVARRGVSVETA